MSKLIKNKSSLMLVIPKDLVKLFSWNENTEVLVSKASYGEKKLLIEEMPKQ